MIWKFRLNSFMLLCFAMSPRMKTSHVYQKFLHRVYIKSYFVEREIKKKIFYIYILNHIVIDGKRYERFRQIDRSLYEHFPAAVDWIIKSQFQEMSIGYKSFLEAINDSFVSHDWNGWITMYNHLKFVASGEIIFFRKCNRLSYFWFYCSTRCE